ncbi:MAG: GNAT family N-acetyltransferase [Anaerolineaceae bacterium]|nr:GNAT family N-acetyltransferase [Anaerolineaceae bacterium]
MINAKKPSDLQSCQTNRLLLQRPIDAHLPAVVAVHIDPETNRFNPSGPPTAEVCKTLFSTWLAHWHDHGFGYWSVATLQQPDLIIGFGGIVLKKIAASEVLNLYFRFSPAAWGKGYATELGQAAIHSAFHVLDFAEVHALVRPDNLPSCAVLKRLGLQQIGEIDDVPGQPPSLLFNISKETL